jgi:hypothetical protein
MATLPDFFEQHCPPRSGMSRKDGLGDMRGGITDAAHRPDFWAGTLRLRCHVLAALLRPVTVLSVRLRMEPVPLSYCLRSVPRSGFKSFKVDKPLTCALSVIRRKTLEL